MNLPGKIRTGRRLAGQLARTPSELRNVPRTVRSQGTPLDVGLPWLAFVVIDRLDEIVGPESSVFEFGGGGSTVWFAERARQVTSIEHDPEWAALLEERFAATPNVDVRHVAAAGGSYDEYVASVESFPDDSLDVVLVDGRSRVRCALAAMPKVRPGGFLVLDDSQRKYYGPAHEALAPWPHETLQGMAPYKFDFGVTTFWRRPAEGD
ncbi:class I SAM-dependent methyltransferase [Luteimicrobium sp. NPDC057192]|uniref:class I SAM-dependent methyltransferase n=1 Tax=Luteimicrobium sp. NPDC057192 TaxID=3346042 RepID=UPI00362DC933